MKGLGYVFFGGGRRFTGTVHCTADTCMLIKSAREAESVTQSKAINHAWFWWILFFTLLLFLSCFWSGLLNVIKLLVWLFEWLSDHVPEVWQCPGDPLLAPALPCEPPYCMTGMLWGGLQEISSHSRHRPHPFPGLVPVWDGYGTEDEIRRL